MPFTALRQWHISADGTLPTAATQLTACVLGASQTLLPPNTTKAKIFTIGGNKILSYIAAPYIATSVTNHYRYGASMQTYNLTSTAHEAIVYQAPISYPSTDYDYQQIWGFEYLPTQNMFCFAYVDENASGTPLIFNGGLGYAAPSSTNTTFTAIALTDGLNYRYSDLELNSHNDLFLVYQDDAGNGTVKYLSASALTGFPSSVSPVACSTSVAANVPILNWQMKVNLLSGYGSWYFGNQIRGENYNNWGDFANQVYGQQVITTDVTWSPTSNPTGTTTDHILIDTNIIIAPGGSLHIENMTLEMAKGTSIIVQNSPTSTGWGGILYVRSSTITSSFGCGIKSTWGGIKIEGNPTYPPNGFGTAIPQGNAFILYSTISYADIGIQNGAYPSIAYSGGNLNVEFTSFINNSTSVLLNPYTYMSSYGELATNTEFMSCSFTNDAATLFPMVFMAVVKNVKGAWFNNCTFNNSTGTMCGIYTIDADTKIDYSTFNNCNTGIYSASALGTHSATIGYNTFNNNQYGVVSRGDITIDIHYNTFNIPKYTGCCPTTYPHSDALLVNDQNIGALMISSTGYKMSNNMFHTNAPTGSYFAYTSGTLESNTGSDVNHITNNSFKGLGVAMNSNFVNNNVGLGGLRYLCNADTNVYCDIGVFGDNLHHGGINYNQATYNPTIAPAFNKFAPGVWEIDNSQSWLNYYYDSYVPIETPISTYIFGNVNILPMIAESDKCPYPTGSGSTFSPVTQGGSDYLTDMNYYISASNVHYYMTLNDTSSKPDLHRDSLYYWAGMMNSPYGDLLVSNLLIEDGLTDSALSVYTNILNKYKLDSAEANDFAQGKSIITILINHKLSKTDNYKLSTDEVSALRTVVSNTGMWAHARASAWLNVSVGDPMKDNLLYPGIPKTTPGVLAVTEISKGTAQYPNCQYAELLVANCGKDSANLVDISGWILDDNSDNFDNNVCDSNKGITRGHYRFANIDLWKYVPVGSMIIVYNANVNCYGLPDSFTIDTKNNIYWIPIYGIKKSWSYVMERYDGSENSSMCSYCSDTGTTVYTQAYGWATTVLLNDAHDAMQVRCPGCTTQNPNKPAFYQGIGYAKNATSGFVTIKAGTNEAGGPVDYDRGKDASRFVFTGSTAADFASPANWQFYPEDSVYTIPTTLGNVSTNLAKLVSTHQLNMPCCNYSNPNGRYGNSAKTNIDGGGLEISVYPNPAQTVVNFLFSGNSDATIKLMDVTGRLLQQKVVSNSLLTTIGITGYMPGVYLYQVITNTKTQTGKIVIE